MMDDIGRALDALSLFIDDNVRAIRATAYGCMFVGGLMIAVSSRRLHPMRKLYVTDSDIPTMVVNGGSFRAVVASVNSGERELFVDVVHSPWFRRRTVIASANNGDEPPLPPPPPPIRLRLAGLQIDHNTAGACVFQLSERIAHQKVVVNLLHRSPEGQLVARLSRGYRRDDVAEDLLRSGLARVDGDSLPLDKSGTRLLRRYCGAQMVAERNSRGQWHEHRPSLFEQLQRFFWP